jgi:hypothetical protein
MDVELSVAAVGGEAEIMSARPGERNRDGALVVRTGRDD